ncbi:MAG: sulfatase-like hydrolase/transferase [Verrucomicrobiota bacterium]
MRLSIPALSCILALTAAIQCYAASRPNILFLFSDDQRADTIHALGNDGIKTPTLDLLVNKGTTFNRAYCMGANQGAVCVPSRAMLMSGRTLFRVNEQLKNQPTWPEQFSAAGYHTFITGKWHNGGESALRSFQKGKAVFLGGMNDPYTIPIQDISNEHTFINKRVQTEHAVQIFADAAIEFLQQEKSSDAPFLCYVAFNAPHDPRIAPETYHARFKSNQPPVPKNFLPQHPFNNGAMVLRDEELAPWPRTETVVREHLADYYAYVEYLDDQLARILEALNSTGKADNTIIVFSSDHGLAIGSHGLFGKQNLYDHSMRAPLLISGPGLQRQKQSDALCYLLDIFPTLGELTEIPAPMGSEGQSLAPILKGEPFKGRDAILTSYTKVQRAIREDRWKLIVYPQINKLQLFDLANDPSELHDLSKDPKHTPEVDRLLARLKQLQNDAGDTQSLTTEAPGEEAFDFTKVKRSTKPKAAE